MPRLPLSSTAHPPGSTCRWPPGGSPFARAVWAELRRIPAGETRSYGDIARAIRRPTATRAVARANGANRIALIVPCHRVIAAICAGIDLPVNVMLTGGATSTVAGAGVARISHGPTPYVEAMRGITARARAATL